MLKIMKTIRKTLCQYLSSIKLYKDLATRKARRMTSCNKIHWLINKYKCISEGLIKLLHGVTGPQNQSSRNTCNKCQLARPYHAKFRCTTTRSVRDIPCQKHVLPKKSGPKFTKTGEDLLRINAAHHAKFHCGRSNDVQEKRYKIFFLHLSIFWRPRGTRSKVHQSGWWWIARPPLSSCQILSPSENSSTRHLLPKFVDFVDVVTHRQTDTKKQTVNDIVSALQCSN